MWWKTLSQTAQNRPEPASRPFPNSSPQRLGDNKTAVIAAKDKQRKIRPVTISKGTVQSHKGHSHCCAVITTFQLQNFLILRNRNCPRDPLTPAPAPPPLATPA